MGISYAHPARGGESRMSYDQLKERLDARPFAPFRIVTTDGRYFDIKSPSMLWPGRYSAMIGLPDNPNEPDVPAKHISLTMLHIVSVEPIQPSTAA
jgi:hypothetical protein